MKGDLQYLDGLIDVIVEAVVREIQMESGGVEPPFSQKPRHPYQESAASATTKGNSNGLNADTTRKFPDGHGPDPSRGKGNH